MRHLVDFDIPALEAELQKAGFPPSHARPILRTFYQGNSHIDFGRLRVGPRVQAWIEREMRPLSSTVVARVQSADGTVKLLMRFADGAAAECVLMPGYRPGRAAACVSSQIGCAMGCDFCASTRNGLERSLTAGEIAEQYIRLKAEAARFGRRLTSLVFMGMGEPMHNLDNVIGGIRRIADPDVGGLGWRQVTVSTVGIVPGIDRLADADLNVHLALSLHAPDDATRSLIVPANRRYPIAEIMAATRRFAGRTGRIPTIEYCLLAGVNDQDEHARQLALLLDGFRAHVNLIPYNSIGSGISGRHYQRPSADRVNAFLQLLRDSRVVAHLRDTRGDDVSAACGQLRRTTLALAGGTPIGV